MRWLRVSCCSLVVCWVAAAALHAQVIGGGGPTSTDCWVSFDSVPSPNYPPSRPRGVRCADQDSACGDADPALGRCRFSVQIALNSTAFPGCSPSDFPASSFAIPYTGPSNDDHPKHIPDFEPLQLFADGQLPLTSSDTDKLSGFQPVTVTLPIRFTSSGPRYRPATLTLQTTLCQIPLFSGRCPSGQLGDRDKFKLLCTPPLDPMSAQPVSPCSGIASTFQQIQEHIFDRKCSTLATCHGSVEPSHDLCLKPSCGARSAYTDLVGVSPHNFAAASDGLKRVEPGNLEQSLLYRKVLGGRQLNSPMFGSGAYGLRMPFHNPAADRARPRLTAGEIRLLRDWILAGAPAMGFISSPYSCQ